MGTHILKRGWTGEPKMRHGSFTIELRSLRQALQQQIGGYTTQTCRNRLGDARCGVDLAPFTHTAVVGVVTDLYNLTGTAQAADYFGEGTVEMTSGRNAGVFRKVRTYEGGVIRLATPLPFPPEPGDTYTAVAGCRKRHERTSTRPDGVSDCIDKFDNILHFYGEPHLPGVDALTAYPTPGEGGE